MSKYALIPYTERDGIRTVRDSDIKRLFERTDADGLVPIVFYEGAITSAEQFLALARSLDWFFLLKDGEDVVGYTWLNRFENKTARQHFCVFKEYWVKSIDIGKFTLNSFMGLKDNDGKYFFTILTGIIPAWNDRAINFALKCGGKTYGVIPDYIDHGVDAVFIYYGRQYGVSK